MEKKKKVAVSKIGNGQHLIMVDPSLSSFDGDPYFEKKAAAARKYLEKAGLPKIPSKK